MRTFSHVVALTLLPPPSARAQSRGAYLRFKRAAHGCGALHRGSTAPLSEFDIVAPLQRLVRAPPPSFALIYRPSFALISPRALPCAS
jgi:hypothetical protein